MNAEPTQRIIPLGVHVQCIDGHGGSVSRLIVDPLTRRLSHIVVQNGTASGVEHRVPVAWILRATLGSVVLDCTQDALAAIELFVEERSISSNASEYEPSYAVDRSAEFKARHIPSIAEPIPPGELAIQRGAQLMARDGPLGTVTAFFINRADGGITFIVVQLEHRLTKHKQAILIAAVQRMDSRALYLTLARDQTATLPATLLRRRYD